MLHQVLHNCMILEICKITYYTYNTKFNLFSTLTHFEEKYSIICNQYFYMQIIIFSLV